MTSTRDLLRARIDHDARKNQTLVGRIARWLSSDARTLRPLRLELERCRFNHNHELSRLRTLLDAQKARAGRIEAGVATGPDGAPEIV